MLTVDKSWFDKLLYRKMFIHYIFEGGKEEGREESDPEPHGKHSVEWSKETRQCTDICILKKDTMILGSGCTH